MPVREGKQYNFNPKPSFNDTHVLAGLKAGLIRCQLPNQEGVHVLLYQCFVKMKSNERILKHRQRNRMKENHHSGGSKRNLFHDMLHLYSIQKIPVGETSYFYYLNVMSISMATR